MVRMGFHVIFDAVNADIHDLTATVVTDMR